MKNKRIFVSGGAGVIGRVLVEKLLQMGAVLLVGDLKSCPVAWRGKLHYWQGDLNGIALAELTAFDPELFFHLAAGFERTEESPSFFQENFHHNVCLSHSLLAKLAACRGLKRVVFASSYLVYAPERYLFTESPEQAVRLSESAPLSPRNVCGAAKLFHERELDFFARMHPISTLSVRIFRVYGRGSRDVVSRWTRSALEGEPLLVYGKEGRFDYIFADDVAEGLIRLAQTEAAGSVNLGSGVSRSVEEVLSVIQTHVPQIERVEGAEPVWTEASEADIALLKSLTGWQPEYTLETALPKLIAWEKRSLPAPRSSPQKEGVLISSISKKTPLIQAVRQAAEKIGAFQKIHGCDAASTCIGRYAVDQFWQVPLLEEWRVESILDYADAHRIGAIIPTRDAELLFYARHRPLFEKQQIQVMVSPIATLQTALDKKKFADLLQAHGFPSIPTALHLDDLPPSADYVVKMRYGAGSKRIGLKLATHEALAAAKGLEDPIFQPWIEGIEWSVDLYRSLEGTVKGVVCRRRNEIADGESQVTTTASYPALEHLCSSVADLLGIYGPAVFQVLVDLNGCFHLIECNPRFGGASTASLSVGLESFFWFFAESLGASIEDYQFIRSKGEVRQVRSPSDRLIPFQGQL